VSAAVARPARASTTTRSAWSGGPSDTGDGPHIRSQTSVTATGPTSAPRRAVTNTRILSPGAYAARSTVIDRARVVSGTANRATTAVASTLATSQYGTRSGRTTHEATITGTRTAAHATTHRSARVGPRSPA
jgi:hypothetical protein